MTNFPLSKVPSKHTLPELKVRSFIHKHGFRYSLHRRDLDGSPDIVLPSRKKIIFVNGCFWHRHKVCKSWRLPKTNKIFWKTKLDRNRQRDISIRRRLKRKGWDVYVIWTCRLNKEGNGLQKLLDWLRT